MDRKPGYYWVKFIHGGYVYDGVSHPTVTGDWEIARLHEFGWTMEDADRSVFRDEDFSVIGPRIEPPQDDGEQGW